MAAITRQGKSRPVRNTRKGNLSLYPLPFEVAVAAALQAGKPPKAKRPSKKRPAKPSHGS